MIYIQLDIPQNVCYIDNELKAEMELIQQQII
jgi:hypothetical protein